MIDHILQYDGHIEIALKNIKYRFTPSCILFTIHNECLHTSKANILKKWASLNLYCSVHCKMNGYYHTLHVSR